MAEILFRLPGKARYSFAEVRFTDEPVDLTVLDDTLNDLNGFLDGRDDQEHDESNSGGTATRKCQHGTMTLREGKTAKGVWSAYFCPESDRDKQCSPINAVTGEPWKKK